MEGGMKGVSEGGRGRSREKSKSSVKCKCYIYTHAILSLCRLSVYSPIPPRLLISGTEMTTRQKYMPAWDVFKTENCRSRLNEAPPPSTSPTMVPGAVTGDWSSLTQSTLTCVVETRPAMVATEQVRVVAEPTCSVPTLATAMVRAGMSGVAEEMRKQSAIILKKETECEST